MKNKLLLLLFLFSSVSCLAQDIATVWFVWGSSLTQPQLNTIENYGNKTHKIAVNRTWLYSSVCDGVTNYVVVITTVNNTENNFLLNAASQGRILRIGEYKYINEYDPYRGGEFSRIDYVMNPKLPREYNDPNCH